jgi:hypothetical protein
MSTTYKQDTDFISALIDRSMLANAIDWICKNLEPEDVFGNARMKEWAADSGYVEKTE